MDISAELMMSKKPLNPRRYFKELRIQQLRALLALERHGSFAGAAEVLGLSTPTVWQQVRALEEEFQVELARVEGKSVHLTDHALTLIDIAHPLIEGFDSLHDAFTQRMSANAPLLTITSTLQLLKFELAEPLREFRRTHPDVQVSIVDQSSKAAREYLKDGKADLAVVGEMKPETESAFKVTRLMDYPFVLIAPREHPQLRTAKVSLRAIAKEPLVLSHRENALESRVRNTFRKAGIDWDLNVVVDAVSIDLLIDFVARGYGLCVASISPLLLKASESEYKQQLGFRDLSQQFGVESIVLLSRAGRYEPAHHRSLRELVEVCLK